MGIRSFNKYFLLLNLAMAFGRNVLAWYELSRSEDSEGGEKISGSEWMGLASVISASIMEAFGLEVDVLLEPKMVEGSTESTDHEKVQG